METLTLLSSFMSDAMYTRESGSVMVEMAGAVVLLVFLVFGITELGRALYQLNIINKAVSTGARYLARVPEIIGDPHGDPPCQPQTGWSDAVVRAQNMVMYGQEATGTSPVLPDMTVSVTEPPDVRTYSLQSGETHSDCVVVVHAEAPFHSIFGDDVYPELFGNSSTGTTLVLKADAEERYLRLYYAPTPP